MAKSKLRHCVCTASDGLTLYGNAPDYAAPNYVRTELFPIKYNEKMVGLGSTKGCFAGHDHMNNFSVIKDGIRLTYGLSCDHNIYLVPFRGGVLNNFKNDGSFTTQHLIRHRGQNTISVGKEQ